MTDYADKIAQQLVNQALVSILNSNSTKPVDWLAVVTSAVRAGYGYGWAAREYQVKP